MQSSHRALLFIVLVGMLGLLSLPVAAQQTGQMSDVQQGDESALSVNVPPATRLEGLTMVHQDTNRCSAAALTIHLTYFELSPNLYRDIVARLNPYGGDVSVRIEEMATVAEEYGLGAVVRRGGTLDLLKQLVAAGFPVLIENVYYDGPNGWQDWLSHNRVLIGYDDARQEMYFFDPLLGNGTDGRGRPMSYADVDERWRPFNRDYLVIYAPEDEARVEAILGNNWDADYNAVWTLTQAQIEIDGEQPDSFAYFNRGWAQVQLGEYEAAAESFDTARQMGLPWRMFWYEFGAFEAYLQMGRYEDVINLVWQVLQTTDGVEEMYYYIARAYAGQGDINRAIANLEAALYRNRYFTEASDLMAELIQQRNEAAGA